VKQAVGAVLVLGALWMGYQAFDEWRLLNSMGVGADFLAVLGGPSKQEAVVKGVICIVALVIGIGFLNDGD
jgi:hypothetical protein